MPALCAYPPIVLQSGTVPVAMQPSCPSMLTLHAPPIPCLASCLCPVLPHWQMQWAAEEEMYGEALLSGGWLAGWVVCPILPPSLSPLLLDGWFHFLGPTSRGIGPLSSALPSPPSSPSMARFELQPSVMCRTWCPGLPSPTYLLSSFVLFSLQPPPSSLFPHPSWP